MALLCLVRIEIMFFVKYDIYVTTVSYFCIPLHSIWLVATKSCIKFGVCLNLYTHEVTVYSVKMHIILLCFVFFQGIITHLSKLMWMMYLHFSVASLKLGNWKNIPLSRNVEKIPIKLLIYSIAVLQETICTRPFSQPGTFYYRFILPCGPVTIR